MEPTLHDGDLVLVNRGLSPSPSDGVYAIDTGNGIQIKRLRRKLDGSVDVISDNDRKYETENYPADTIDSLFRLVGKVVRTYWAAVR